MLRSALRLRIRVLVLFTWMDNVRMLLANTAVAMLIGHV
jgi:hypothetical protein